MSRPAARAGKGSSEELLRQRICRGADCGAVFWICRHCDRGHRYCGERCRRKARRQQVRTANRRHQQSREGRLDHRDRQRAYRDRCRYRRVTDHTSTTPFDFILEHPGMNWLPAEPEKVEFFEKLGLPRRLIPRRIYYGAVGNQKRYFALKLPLAVDPETVTFVYVDPGHRTDTELRSWGAAHGPLWDAIRTKGRQVRVIGIAVENAAVDRTARLLEAWAAAEPGTPDEGLTVKQEIKAIHEAITRRDQEFLAQYGGYGGAGRRSVELQRLPEAKLTEGVSIDDYSTWRAVRFADRDEVG